MWIVYGAPAPVLWHFKGAGESRMNWPQENAARRNRNQKNGLDRMDRINRIKSPDHQSGFASPARQRFPNPVHLVHPVNFYRN
jgi:hypothetical protein